MPATIRPDEWNFPLLLHVGGAMLMVGALVASAAALVLATRGGPAERGVLARFGFRALLLGAIPAYIVMRVGAQWIASKEGVEDSDAAWITIGYITSEPGLLLMIAATVVAGLAVRRIRRPDGGGASRAAPILALLLVALYIVAIWAMATKPT